MVIFPDNMSETYRGHVSKRRCILCVTFVSCMTFTLLLMQDSRRYMVEKVTPHEKFAINKHVSHKSDAIQQHPHYNESITQEKFSSMKYRVSRRTLATNILDDLPLKSSTHHSDVIHSTQQSDVSHSTLQSDAAYSSWSETTVTQSVPTTDGLKSALSCGQEARQRLMTQACDRLKEEHSSFTDISKFKDKLTSDMIFVDDKRKLLYCEVPKVACTSWKVLFANLTGMVDPEDYDYLPDLVHDTTYHPTVGFKYLNEYTVEEKEYRIKHYFKFLVTRNPYSRIISAFKNKFLGRTPQSEWYHSHVGKYIIRKYRYNASESSYSTGHDVTFREFVKFVGDSDDANPMRFDPHWWNVNSICFPCLYKYDYIAKLETIEEDIDYLLKRIFPNETVTFPYLNSNAKSKMYDPVGSEAFFRNISEIEKSRLNKVYAVDLNTFGYSISQNNLECQL